MYHNGDVCRKKYLVPAVDQAIRVMFCLVENGNNPKSLTDICQEVGIHRSKAFSILDTLLEYDLVKKNPHRKGYVLGPGLLTLTGKCWKTSTCPTSSIPSSMNWRRKPALPWPSA